MTENKRPFSEVFVEALNLLGQFHQRRVELDELLWAARRARRLPRGEGQKTISWEEERVRSEGAGAPRTSVR